MEVIWFVNLDSCCSSKQASTLLRELFAGSCKFLKWRWSHSSIRKHYPSLDSSVILERFLLLMWEFWTLSGGQCINILVTAAKCWARNIQEWWSPGGMFDGGPVRSIYDSQSWWALQNRYCVTLHQLMQWYRNGQSKSFLKQFIRFTIGISGNLTTSITTVIFNISFQICCNFARREHSLSEPDKHWLL